MTLQRRLRLWILLVLVTAAGPALAQKQQQPRPASVFGERIEVRVVNLEVVVVDRKGQRVAGLGPEDFRLRVDGRELPVGYFTEISEGRVSDGGEAAAPTRSVAGLEAGQQVGTSYLVFIDDFFTIYAAERNQVLAGIRDSLGQLGPEDRMAIVAFDGRDLDMLSNWTGSSVELARVFEGAMERPVRGFITTAGVRNADRDLALQGDIVASQDVAAGLGQAPGTFGASSREASVCAHIHRMERQLKRATMGVTASLRSFAQPPGRKVLLLLSGGWPYSVEDYVLGRQDPITRTGECTSDGPKLYRQVFDTANLLGYTVYPIDVPGRDSSPISAELSSFIDPIDRSTREDEVHTTLYRIAEETGGRPLINSTRLAAFERVVEDTRSYYWLGFTPDWQGDDSRHKIKLNVLRPGLKVRYREGFQDLSRSAEVSFIVESALLFGGLPGGRPLGLRFGPIPKGKRKVVVPVEVVIPMDEITMLPHQGRYMAELELRVAVLDEMGNRNDMPVIPVVLAGDGPPPRGSHAIYETAVRIRRQQHDIVVALYDPLTDRVLASVGRIDP